MHSTEQLLKTALGHHQSGELDRASGLYQRILRVDPGHADALHLLGVAAHQSRDYQRAVELITQAIEIDASSPLYLSNLGAAYRELDELDNAVDCFREAVRIAPEFAGAHYNLAMSLDAGGDVDGALAAYARALRLDPQFADAHNNLGRLYASLERWTDAIASFQAAIAANPEMAEALYNLGNAYLDVGQIESAIECFQKAIALAPRVAAMHNNLGEAYKQQGRYSRAGECFRRAVELAPNDASAHNNLGSVLQYEDQLDQALAAFQRALELRPDFAGAHINLGNVYNERGDLPAAIACYERAIDLEPISAEAGFNRALALLRAGEFAEGWEEYEWRWKRKVSPRRFDVPEWDGSRLHGRTLLIHAEQGIGDELMFASCLPELLQPRGRYLIECDSRLVPLFARSFQSARVIARRCADETADRDRSDRAVARHPRSSSRSPIASRRKSTRGAGEVESADCPADFDLQIALGSLPRILGGGLESYPRSRNYLHADPRLRGKWRSRFEALGSGFRVGIAWQGGKEPDVARKRSTRLDQWMSLLSVPGAHFVNLQHGACRHEPASLAHQPRPVIHDWPDADPVRELDDFAAQVAELDLVISVDNSTVHLAGALGVDAWVLLPAAADWRWLLDRADSYWYPTLRLFRQTRRGDWPSVFNQVECALRDRLIRCPHAGGAQP